MYVYRHIPRSCTFLNKIFAHFGATLNPTPIRLTLRPTCDWNRKCRATPPSPPFWRFATPLRRDMEQFNLLEYRKDLNQREGVILCYYLNRFTQMYVIFHIGYLKSCLSCLRTHSNTCKYCILSIYFHTRFPKLSSDEYPPKAKYASCPSWSSRWPSLQHRNQYQLVHL